MVKKGQFTNSPDFECDLKSGSQTIWNPDKWPPFFKKPSEIWTKISRFWIIQFHMFRALWKLDFQKVWISNLWIWYPTVQEVFVWHKKITCSHYNFFCVSSLHWSCCLYFMAFSNNGNQVKIPLTSNSPLTPPFQRLKPLFCML